MIKKMFQVFILIILFLNFNSCSNLSSHKKVQDGNKTYYKDYKSYTKKMRELIIKRNIRGKNVVNEIMPFDFQPKKECSGRKKKGIILIHGLWNTPYSMRPLGKFFSQNCFRARGILLNGHGTKIEDNFNVDYKDWMGLVSWNIEELKKEVDEVYLLGSSLGGVLSVRMAIEKKIIKGVFLFSPALALPWYSFMLSPSSLFVDYMKKRKEDDFYSYRSADVNGPLQTHRLAKETEDILKKRPLEVPVLSFLFAGDRRTLDPKKVHKIMVKGFKNLNSFVYLEKDTDLVYLKEFDGQSKKIKSYNLKEKIYGQSHLSLITPPNDPYYGKRGIYRDCEHYLEKSKDFKACKSESYDGAVWSGEVTKKNLKKGLMRRLRYNPLWQSMLEEIKKHLSNSR